MLTNLYVFIKSSLKLFILSLSLTLLFVIQQSYAASLSVKDLPGIYVERVIDRGTSLIPALKMKYSLCVSQKKMARAEFLNQSDAWFEMKQVLDLEYLAYIAQSPYAEPKWHEIGIGLNREKEYFYGDKYKQVKYGQKFRISERDGLCRLESYGEYEKQYIDDGAFRYKVTLKHKKHDSEEYESVKIRRSISPVMLRKQRGMRNELLTEDVQESVIAFLAKHGKVDSLSLLKVDDTEGLYSLDQLCNDVSSSLTKGSICYWNTMPVYPTVMERPIILKKKQNVFQKNVVEKVVRFELYPALKDEVFKPPLKSF